MAVRKGINMKLMIAEYRNNYTLFFLENDSKTTIYYALDKIMDPLKCKYKIFTFEDLKHQEVAFIEGQYRISEYYRHALDNIPEQEISDEDFKKIVQNFKETLKTLPETLGIK